jgi:DNA-binding transcriptional MerR regulator
MLSIGRFSQVCRLSVRTLRRYDADDLLVPALVDASTGRRYYSPAQVGEARLIRLLRDLDVPLAEVRGLLAVRDPADARAALAAHRARLAEQLRHQRAVLSELDGLLADPDPVTRAVVVRRSLPEQLALTARTRTTLAALPAAFGAALGRVERLLHEQAGRRTGPTLAIYHGEEFDPEQVDVEVAVPVAGWLAVRDGVDARVMPPVDAVATMHAGPYDRIGSAYQALAHWSADRGLVLGDQPREIYVVGPDRAGPEGLRTEVVWPLAEQAP